MTTGVFSPLSIFSSPGTLLVDPGRGGRVPFAGEAFGVLLPWGVRGPSVLGCTGPFCPGVHEVLLPWGTRGGTGVLWHVRVRAVGGTDWLEGVPAVVEDPFPKRTHSPFTGAS